MVAHSHLTVNVICTLTVLSLFIPAPHFSQTLLPVCHHITSQQTALFTVITISTSGLTCGILSITLFLFLCCALLSQSLAWIQSQAHLCGVCGVQGVSATDFCPSTKVFTCTQCSFVHHHCCIILQINTAVQ